MQFLKHITNKRDFFDGAFTNKTEVVVKNAHSGGDVKVRKMIGHKNISSLWGHVKFPFYPNFLSNDKKQRVRPELGEFVPN